MRTGTIFVFLLAATLSNCGEKARIGNAIEKLGNAPSKFVLYSLDPRKRHEESLHNQKVFHGFNILGRAQITDSSEQRALLRALAHGVRENDGPPAACFDPRHALHVDQGGRSIDLVICFECSQVHAYGFNQHDSFLTSASPQPIFDDSLRRHGLPLARK